MGECDLDKKKVEGGETGQVLEKGKNWNEDEL